MADTWLLFVQDVALQRRQSYLPSRFDALSAKCSSEELGSSSAEEEIQAVLFEVEMRDCLQLSLKQRLQEAALSPQAYSRFRQQCSAWFQYSEGSAEELYETFLEVFGHSQELLFLSLAGALCSRSY